MRTILKLGPVHTGGGRKDPRGICLFINEPFGQCPKNFYTKKILSLCVLEMLLLSGTSGGMDVLTISRRLGHGSPTTTPGVYGHLFGNSDAADVIERAFGKVLNENTTKTAPEQNRKRPVAIRWQLAISVGGANC